MRLMRSVVTAFAMFSAIPMPRVKWEPENRRYALAALPLVGAVVGLCVWGWVRLCELLSLGAALFGAGAALLPHLCAVAPDSLTNPEKPGPCLALAPALAQPCWCARATLTLPEAGWPCPRRQGILPLPLWGRKSRPIRLFWPANWAATAPARNGTGDRLRDLAPPRALSRRGR